MSTPRTIPVKSHRFDLDWWVVSKRPIYGLIALGVLLLCAGGFAGYCWLYGNPFKRIVAHVDAPAGARFLSFDGDVRVVRAQTRETLLARSDTQLYPGDIVQTQADGRARIQLADGSTLVLSRMVTTLLGLTNRVEPSASWMRARPSACVCTMSPG